MTTSKYNVLIVKPKNYIYWQAFSELAEIVAYMLADQGHQVVISHSIVKGARNIVLGSHLLPDSLISEFPSDSVMLNAEQLLKDDNNWNPQIFKWCSHFETWDYNDSNIIKLAENGITAKKLIIGFHPKLRRIPKVDKQDIDVLFYGGINDRRQEIYSRLQRTSLNTQFVYDIFGKERDALIARSKIIINIHLYSSEIFEIVRCFYLMTNSKAIVSEVNPSTSIDSRYQDGICSVGYEGLVDKCLELIANDKERLRLEEKAYATIQSVNTALSDV